MSTSERTAVAGVPRKRKVRFDLVPSVDRPSKRHLAQVMFDFNNDDFPQVKSDIKKPIDPLPSSNTRSTMRRTKSDFAMDCSSHTSLLSANMSNLDLNDSQTKPNEVFMTDIPHNISAFSDDSGHQKTHGQDRAIASCFAVNRADNSDVSQSLCQHSSYVSMLGERHYTVLAQYDTQKSEMKDVSRIKFFRRHQSLLNLNEDSLETAEMYKATSLANVSSETNDAGIKKRMNFGFN